MQTEFTQSFFMNNRKKLGKMVGADELIVIPANGRMQRSGDTAFQFQQDAHFWYLTGIDEPDIVLVIDASESYLILPEQSEYQQVFDGSPNENILVEQSGVDAVYGYTEGWKRLHGRLRKATQVATLTVPSSYVDVYGMYTNPARSVLVERLRQTNSKLKLLDLTKHMVGLRTVKQPVELAAIERAIAITANALQEVTRPTLLRKYAWEYEIEASLSKLFRTEGGSGHAFEPIVASGYNATVLHYIANNGRLSRDSLVVIDVGAAYRQYAADITRTVAIGSPSQRQQDIYAAVKDVQAYAISLLKPGVLLHEYEAKVATYMGTALRQLKLIKDNDTDSIRQYFPHATSHHLGLNVHDVADYSQPLEPGMVLTVEPGIYVAAESVGVRIEDDVVITKTGVRVLSDSLPRTLN